VRAQSACAYRYKSMSLKYEPTSLDNESSEVEHPPTVELLYQDMPLHLLGRFGLPERKRCRAWQRFL